MQNLDKVSWSLFDKKSNAQINALSFAQVKSFVASLTAADIDNWWVWYEGQTDWSALRAYLAIILPPGSSKVYQAPPFPPTHHLQDGKVKSAIEPLAVFDMTIDSRKSKRIQKTLNVRGKSAKLREIYEGQTVDISSGGFQVAVSVNPDWEDPTQFKIFDSRGQQLVVDAAQIWSPGAFRRHFRIVKCSNVPLLNIWLTE